MKKLNFIFILLVFFLTIINTACSPHCDDEDYTRDQEAVVHHKDSLKVLID